MGKQPDFFLIALENGKKVQFDPSGQVELVLGGNESLNNFELDEAQQKFTAYRGKVEFDAEVEKVRALHEDPDFNTFAEDLRYEKTEEELAVINENPFLVTREWEEKMGARGPSPEQEAVAAREAKLREKRCEVLRAKIKQANEAGHNSDEMVMELFRLGGA